MLEVPTIVKANMEKFVGATGAGTTTRTSLEYSIYWVKSGFKPCMCVRGLWQGCFDAC